MSIDNLVQHSGAVEDPRCWAWFICGRPPPYKMFAVL
jgi:hypothetical protein